MVNRSPQNLRGRDEISIEDQKKFPFRAMEPMIQRTPFIPGSDLPPEDHRIETLLAKAVDLALGDPASFVSRIIQDLDLEFLLWIVELADGAQEPFDHVDFVIDGKLDRDDRKLTEPLRSIGASMLVLE